MLKVEDMSDCYKNIIVSEIKQYIISIIVYTSYLALFFTLSLSAPSIIYFIFCFMMISFNIYWILVTRQQILKLIKEILFIKE